MLHRDGEFEFPGVSSTPEPTEHPQDGLAWLPGLLAPPPKHPLPQTHHVVLRKLQCGARKSEHGAELAGTQCARRTGGC